MYSHYTIVLGSVLLMHYSVAREHSLPVHAWHRLHFGNEVADGQQNALVSSHSLRMQASVIMPGTQKESGIDDRGSAQHQRTW